MGVFQQIADDRQAEGCKKEPYVILCCARVRLEVQRKLGITTGPEPGGRVGCNFQDITGSQCLNIFRLANFVVVFTSEGNFVDWVLVLL